LVICTSGDKPFGLVDRPEEAREEVNNRQRMG